MTGSDENFFAYRDSRWLNHTSFTFESSSASLNGQDVRQLAFEVQNVVVLAQVPPWSFWLAAATAAIGLVPLFEARKKDTGWFLFSYRYLCRFG